ncbi:GLPGLI family protein [Sphingobacterium sp. Mn56C]|uniref:GLPGLI family protein n=1 Tax=Sphingobacterium sp. Mn56C TaxID=3395261 RepID=UPI003BBF40F5
MLLFFLGTAMQLRAQYAFFPNSGTVTYERRFHIVNFLKRNYLNKVDLDTWDKMYVDNVIKNGPNEVVTKHTLSFFNQETLFESTKEDYPSNYSAALRYLPVFNESKTYVNYHKGTFQKLLPFGADELLLADSIPTVRWRYTDEYRNIAGYECRRANGLVQDSIYVVAFFTNQIDIPGGPELVQGLPGLILGVSIPTLNINMFATKVELTNTPVSSVLTKKKKVVPENKEQVTKKLKATVYDWYTEEKFQKQMSKVLF